jgi:fructose transport system ATP-binding protein
MNGGITPSRGGVVLSARQLTKRFGPIQACTEVDLDIRAGALTAIVGDNGAGKSTLIKMLAGALQPDSGSILLRGQEVHFADPLQARSAGVETVYQTLALAPNLDTVSNVFLGRELTRRVVGIPFTRQLDEARMHRATEAEIKNLDVRIPRIRGIPLGKMSGGQQQSVAIARAAFWAKEVLLMDEPTAALGLKESRAVLDLVRRIVERGIAVVMISHILPHVIELADAIVVMRHGQKVAELQREDASMDNLVRLIVGA